MIFKNELSPLRFFHPKTPSKMTQAELIEEIINNEKYLMAELKRVEKGADNDSFMWLAAYKMDLFSRLERHIKEYLRVNRLVM